MTMSKKHKVIEALYKKCKKCNNFVFDNQEVKKISTKIGFGNPFDVTKIDSKEKLPPLLIKDDIAIVHLGSGVHQFVSGIDNLYHDFEPIHRTIEWHYKKSLLNQFNSSESNILSVANNQRILHDFLFKQDREFSHNDIAKRSKTYFPHRTKTSFEYNIDDVEVALKNIQIEIDLTIEFDGIIGVFEAKNGTLDSFSIYQLYHPFLYYYNANMTGSLNGKVKEIYGIYVVRKKENNFDVLRLWSYTFENPLNINSIKLVKSAIYKLIPK